VIIIDLTSLIHTTPTQRSSFGLLTSFTNPSAFSSILLPRVVKVVNRSHLRPSIFFSKDKFLFIKIKEFVNFVKDNPVTRFFFGDSNDKSLKVGAGFDAGSTADTGAGFGGGGTTAPNFDTGGGLFEALGLGGAGVSRNFTLRQLKNMGITQEIANQLAAEDVVRNAKMQAQIDARSSRPSINVTVNGALDAEGTARTIVDTLNNSFYRGTGGSNNLVTA